MPTYVYILRSRSADRFYVGVSEHPETRLEYHNGFERGFTSRYRPWKLVFTKEFPTRTLALAAERKIKSWKSASRIAELIDGSIAI